MPDRCPSCGLSPYESGIGDSDISRIVAEHNALLARAEKAEAERDHYRFHFDQQEQRAEKAEAALRLACREIVELRGESKPALAADVNYVVGEFAALAVPGEMPA